MFSYDPSTKILKVCKVPEPDAQLDLVSYQRESYQRYLDSTVKADVEVLCDAMVERLNVKEVSAEVTVGDLCRRGNPNEIKKLLPSFYPVYAKFTIDGCTYREPVEVLRIPEMDEDGILNFGGNRRVLTMQLVADEKVSYAAESKTVSVTLPKRNISLLLGGTKDILVKYGKSKVPMHKLIRAYNSIEAAYDDPSELFASPFIRSAFARDSAAADITISSEIGKLNIIDTYNSADYDLGKTRDVLNSVLSIDRALGRVLSRPIGPFEVGTTVTEAVLDYCYTNLINEIYVKSVPNVIGYKLTSNVLITVIPAGTRNNARLRELLPEDAAYAAIPEQRNVNLYMMENEPLSAEDIALLQDVGALYIDCVCSGAAPIRAYFEEEIIGNHTVKCGAVYGAALPAGVSYDDWVFYTNGKVLPDADTSKLNIYDLMALYSLCAGIREHPEKNALLDKDFGLLKKVEAANEIFSKIFREEIPAYVNKCASRIQRAINSNVAPDCFKGFNQAWEHRLWEDQYIKKADTINPIATIAQTNAINSSVSGSAVPSKMRLLSMGYYGRICPYETPAGPKIGIANTKAVGAIIEDGILKTPYRKVIKSNTGISGISNNLTYLNAQEEANYRIGDILSLKQENGRYVNNKVIARVPAPGRQVSVESVDAFSLDYVNAFCEQHMSPTAALIPFAGANNDVRVTNATHMLKQSILLQESEVPRVFTSMYRHCFDHSNTFVIRAKKDGWVEDIPLNKLCLSYNDGTFEDIPIHETSVIDRSVNYLHFHVKEGSTFKAGDILVDSAIAKEGIYSPGLNLFCAYISSGYNYEDAIDLGEGAANKFISISTETVTQRVTREPNSSILAHRRNFFHFIPENSVLTEFSKKDRVDPRRVSKEEMRSGRHSGILYSMDREDEGNRTVTYKASLLSFNRLRTGDKLSGRHSNKGIVARIQKDSLMPCFMNGQPVEVLLNPCGVPSRMNIGQNFEAFLGFVATLLDVHIESNSFNGATRGDVKLLMKYVWDIANSENINTVIPNYPMLPAELHEQARARYAEITNWRGCFEPDGTARLWNPETGKPFESNATFGVTYLIKLEHEVNGKIHARGGMLEEDYAQISKQPTEGSASGGGQKMGEMEMVAMAAYGANNLLEETLNASSDNVLARTYSTINTLGLQDKWQAGWSKQFSIPHSVEMFRYRLEALGIKMCDDGHILPPCNQDTNMSRTVPDIRSIVSGPDAEETPEQRTDNLLNALKGAFK